MADRDFRTPGLIRKLGKALADFQTRADAALATLDATTADAAMTQAAAQLVLDQLTAALGQLQVATAPGQTATVASDPLVTVITATTVITPAGAAPGPSTAAQALCRSGAAVTTDLTVRLAGDQARLNALLRDPTANAAEILRLQAFIPATQTLIAAVTAGTVVVRHAKVTLPAVLANAQCDLIVTWPAAFTDAAYTVDPPTVHGFPGVLAFYPGAVTAPSAAVGITPSGAPVIAGSVLDIYAYRYTT